MSQGLDTPCNLEYNTFVRFDDINIKLNIIL